MQEKIKIEEKIMVQISVIDNYQGTRSIGINIYEIDEEKNTIKKAKPIKLEFEEINENNEESPTLKISKTFNIKEHENIKNELKKLLEIVDF